jgi:pimeloyl-ACP methyl ester carboxylesterase
MRFVIAGTLESMSSPRYKRAFGVFALALCAAAGGALAAAAALGTPVAANATAARADHERVGTLSLERCSGAAAYCGRLERALDPTGAIPDRISIYFEWYPHTMPGKSLGTLVATEGGPGYPATGSRDDYLALFKPLRSNRDVLLMDNRGTGNSGALDCPDLQTGEKWTVEAVAACGASLGARSALYSTAYAADDLAAILEALQALPIDLYGDSYGTFFAQVFAVRHPDAMRSIVLDGAYPLDGPGYAWYPSYAPAMGDKFNLACRRSPACAKLTGDSIAHILPTLEMLRRNPFAARAADSDGKEREFTADAPLLAIVMFAGAPALATVRELDAAARAFADADRPPLLRLMAETISGVDSRDPTANVSKWSAALAAAVMCQDAPQIYDMRLAPALRAADRDRAIAQRQLAFPDTYAPFTIAEYRSMPLDYSFIDQCVGWPVAPAAHPASRVVAADAPYPDIPALIISGELDDITTPADGAAAAKAFKQGRQVLIANSFHVNALPRARSICGAGIARQFLATLESPDIGCAIRVAPVRLVSRFATHAAELDPATALRGNSAGTLELRYAAAAVLTAGDVLVRLSSNSSGRGKGLRGGSYRIIHAPGFSRIELSGVRWTEDLAVSGTIEAPAGHSGTVRARLEIVGPALGRGRLRIRWQEGVADALAQIRGMLGAASVVAQTPAP